MNEDWPCETSVALPANFFYHWAVTMVIYPTILCWVCIMTGHHCCMSMAHRYGPYLMLVIWPKLATQYYTSAHAKYCCYYVDYIYVKKNQHMPCFILLSLLTVSMQTIIAYYTNHLMLTDITSRINFVRPGCYICSMVFLLTYFLEVFIAT